MHHWEIILHFLRNGLMITDVVEKVLNHTVQASSFVSVQLFINGCCYPAVIRDLCHSIIKKMIIYSSNSWQNCFYKILWIHTDSRLLTAHCYVYKYASMSIIQNYKIHSPFKNRARLLRWIFKGKCVSELYKCNL